MRREFDMLAVWSSDRLGRSLRHLVEVLETIRDTGTGLYIHTQSVDTTTPAGRAMFGMLGIFAEFEREMIQTRIKAGMDRVRTEMDRNGGKYTSRKSGVVRSSLGRPGAVTKDTLAAARAELAKGTGILKTAKQVGLGTGTVQRLKQAMEAEGALPQQRRRRGHDGGAPTAVAAATPPVRSKRRAQEREEIRRRHAGTLPASRGC